MIVVGTDKVWVECDLSKSLSRGKSPKSRVGSGAGVAVNEKKARISWMQETAAK
jgi:hypothetical protein